MKFKITVYNVKSMHRFILNIVPTKLYNKNKNKLKDRDSFDFQNIKRARQSLYSNIFYSSVLAAKIVGGNLMNYLAATAKILQ